MRLFFTAILLVLLCAGFNAYSYPDTGKYAYQAPLIKNFTSDDGLPQNNIRKIIQDANGYIWVSTLNGLTRLDGHTIKTFDESNLKELTSSIILDIKTAGPYIWMYTTDEIVCMQNGKVYARFALPQKVESFQPLQSFNQTISTIILLNKNLYHFNNGKFFRDKDIPFAFNSFHAYSDAYIFFSTTDKHLLLYATQSKRTFFIDSLSDLDIRGDKNNLYYWNSSNELILLPGLNIDARQKIYKAIPPVYSITTFPDGYAFTEKDSMVYVKGLPGNDVQKLPLAIFGTTNIRSLCFDRNNNLWVGSSEKGLFMVSHSIIRNYDPISSPEGKEIYFAKGIDGMIYTGSYDGLFGLNVTTGDYRPSNLFPGYPYVWDIEKTDKNTWIIATYGLGMIINNKGHITSCTVPVLPSNNVFCLYKSKNNLLWIGTASGIACMDSMHHIYRPEIKTAGSATPNHFAEMKNGDLYVATDEGILIIGKDLRLKKQITKSDGLPSNKIRSLYIDEDKNVWVGTLKGGLCLLSGDHIYSFPYGSGKLNADILSVTEDRYHYLWLSSNQGLYKVKKSDLLGYAHAKNPLFSVQKYAVPDGLRNPEFNSHTQGKVYKDSIGNLWYPNINGLVSVTPEKPLPDTSHKLLFDEFIINGSMFYNRNGKIIIPSPQNRIHITYAVPEFNTPENLFFEYKTDGQDDNWIFNSNKREIELANLPEGNYTLHVRQYSLPGNSISIKLVVNAPFLQSRIFKMILIAAGILLAVFIAILFQKKVHKNKIKKIEAEKEILTLKMVALQKQINPHFIFNSLHSLQCIFLEKNFRLANEYIANFSSLLRTSLEYARDDSSSLAEELSLIENYLALEQLQFGANEFHYEIHVQEGISANEIRTPTFLLQPFVENAIKHGLKKPGHQEKKIIITVFREKEIVVVQIKDNGPGIKNTFSAQAKSDSGHQSRGMEITRTKIAAFNKMYHQNITLAVGNIYPEAAAKGTVVTIRL